MAGERGFTLIEVLVALAILAVSLTAGLRVCSIATDTAFAFRQRMLAGWVAENRLAEYAIGLTPEPGERAGTVEQGGISFTWRERVSATESPRLHRIDVQVFAAGVPEHALARLAGYATRAR
jgi:general secretion pathway protein I